MSEALDEDDELLDGEDNDDEDAGASDEDDLGLEDGEEEEEGGVGDDDGEAGDVAEESEEEEECACMEEEHDQDDDLNMQVAELMEEMVREQEHQELVGAESAGTCEPAGQLGGTDGAAPSRSDDATPGNDGEAALEGRTESQQALGPTEEGAKGGGDDDDRGEGAEGEDGDGGDDAEQNTGEDLQGEGTVEGRGGKPVDPSAPKRPLLPYQQYCTTARAQILERSPALRGDLQGMGAALAEAWAGVPAGDKAEMQARYDEAKAAYDREMEAYKQTGAYKQFAARLREWQDTRELKKFDKKHKQGEGVPARPRSPYSLFAAGLRDQLKAEGVPSDRLFKELSERWSALPAAERVAYEQAAESERKRFEADNAKYKKSDLYRSYINDRAALELKQGLRRIKAQFEDKKPKRPSPSFMLWAAQSGATGSFVDRSAAFQKLPDEERSKWEEEAAKLKKQFSEEMSAFLESSEGKSFTQQQEALKKKLRVRSTACLVLAGAPKKPPGAAALFAAAKKGELASMGFSGGALTQRSAELWESAEEAERQPFIDEAARLMEDFNARMEDFKQSDDYKAMVTAKTRNSKGTGRGRGGGRGKAGPGSKGRGSGRVMVPPPESMPVAPLSDFQLFCSELEPGGSTTAALSKRFSELAETERARLSAEAKRRKDLYDQAMIAFSNSKEGKRYARKVEAEKRRAKIERAKRQYLADEPRKPPPAMQLYAKAMKGSGRGKPGVQWSALGADDRAKWEAEHAKLMEEYSKRMEEFHQSDNFKKFSRIAAPPKEDKDPGKGQGRGSKRKQGDAAPSTKTPESAGAPPKPPRALQLFMKSQQGKIRGGLSAISKAWGDLGPGGQKPFHDEAAALKSSYEGELAAWKRSKDGKAFAKESAKKDKALKEQRARAKYLSQPGIPDAPKKPKTAFALFVDSKRPEIAKEQAGLSGPQQVQRISKLWAEIDETGKVPFETKAKELRDAYEVALRRYKQSPQYRKYERAIGTKKKGLSKKEKAALEEERQLKEDMKLVYGLGRTSGGISGLSGPTSGRGRGRGRATVESGTLAGCPAGTPPAGAPLAGALPAGAPPAGAPTAGALAAGPSGGRGRASAPGSSSSGRGKGQGRGRGSAKAADSDDDLMGSSSGSSSSSSSDSD